LLSTKNIEFEPFRKPDSVSMVYWIQASKSQRMLIEQLELSLDEEVQCKLLAFACHSSEPRLGQIASNRKDD